MPKRETAIEVFISPVDCFDKLEEALEYLIWRGFTCESKEVLQRFRHRPTEVSRFPVTIIHDDAPEKLRELQQIPWLVLAQRRP